MLLGGQPNRIIVTKIESALHVLFPQTEIASHLNEIYRFERKDNETRHQQKSLVPGFLLTSYNYQNILGYK